MLDGRCSEAESTTIKGVIKINKIYISDVISEDEIESWQPGDIITISAQTGSGKSHFIKNKLCEYAKSQGKKILLLVSRKACKNAFQIELGDNETIDIMTYQAIQAKAVKEQTFDFDKYTFLVSDEFHFFLDDASFNELTDISFSLIVNAPGATKLFLSATGSKSQRFIEQVTGSTVKNYSVPPDYSHIKSVTFFKDESKLSHFARQTIQKNAKAVFVISSAERAFKLYKVFSENATFCCAENNQTYGKCVNKAEIEAILKTGILPKNLLITTKVFDTGVNLFDKEIRYIVTDLWDSDTVVQCLGRRRFDDSDPNDKVQYYLYLPSDSQIASKIRADKQTLEMADYLKNNGQDEYCKHYGRRYDSTQTVYFDSVKRQLTINPLKYQDKVNSIEEFSALRADNSISSSEVYKRMMCEKIIGNPDYKARVISDNYDLTVFLQQILFQDILLGSDIQKELIQRMNINHDGKLLKSYSVLSSSLDEMDLPYRIIKGRNKSRKTVWRVVSAYGKVPELGDELV